MIRRLVRLLVDHRKILILTFEIFWIVVFLLERASSSGGDVAQFVYVNF